MIAPNGTILAGSSSPQHRENAEFIQSLLDFAVVGFGKCGTTTLLRWLSRHPQVRCLPDENWELMKGRPDDLARWLYQELPADPIYSSSPLPVNPYRRYRRCYKCPADVTQPHVVGYLRLYWPRTKLVVSIRHPVRWFQSLYNFRIQSNETMPPPNRLVGPCKRGMKHGCTERGNFAYHLIRLGKHQQHSASNDSDTKRVRAYQPTDLETRIVSRYRTLQYDISAVPYTPNPVFLLDVEQLADTNATRLDAFREDLAEFLGLDADSLPRQVPHHSPRGMRTYSNETQREIDSRKIDVCDDEHERARNELMRLSKQTAEWMLESGFLDAPGVHVTNRDHFESILRDQYMVDPCSSAKRAANENQR